jgi:hypothetical protein
LEVLELVFDLSVTTSISFELIETDELPLLDFLETEAVVEAVVFEPSRLAVPAALELSRVEGV